MAKKSRGTRQGKQRGVVAFKLDGPIPRWAPYKKFRYRLYVPADTKAWRLRIAAAFLKAGGRKPSALEQAEWSVSYRMVRSHADLDSISHSLQDALSKDALHCVDKEWHVGSIRHVHVATKAAEGVSVTVEYKERDGR
jgi:hypothetical protein